jgi:hypothetical protein
MGWNGFPRNNFCPFFFLLACWLERILIFFDYEVVNVMAWLQGFLKKKLLVKCKILTFESSVYFI